MSGFRGNKRIRMVKVKEKVVGFEVDCDICRNVLVFNQEDETYHDGDRDSCCKDIVCPVCGSNILVRDDFGDLVDEVKIIRVRVI